MRRRLLSVLGLRMQRVSRHRAAPWAPKSPWTGIRATAPTEKAAFLDPIEVLRYESASSGGVTVTISQAGNKMRWILLASMAASMATRSLVATEAQCTGVLQDALKAKNPETRKQAVVALSLAYGSGPL